MATKIELQETIDELEAGIGEALDRIESDDVDGAQEVLEELLAEEEEEGEVA
mgnify:CR=1 FL=1